jgi:hypothetical protein
MKHKVIFQARITYEVNVNSLVTASKKAYMELIESLPFVGDESEDGKVVCTDLLLDQVLPMTEIKE